MRIGDTVRYLNATGGGVVTRIEGKMAYVEEEGFETPVLMNELVVVLPAGHQPQSSARLMFDQQAFDAGKQSARPAKEPEKEKTAPAVTPAITERVEETPHGDLLNISLAFEPTSLKRLSESDFNTVLVNDSNYWLQFAFSTRADNARGWTLVYQGTVAPNELIDLAMYTPADLPGIERVALQAVAWKKDKEFELKNPIAISRRIDITKFHKLHCFRKSIYFDTDVIEVKLISEKAPGSAPIEEEPTEEQRRMLEQSLSKMKPKEGRPAPAKKENVSPYKVTDTIVVDLHMGALTDTLAGMQPKDMLEMQLGEVKKTMEANRKRKGQKIVFIHGKGEGVLRQEVLKLLRRQYPKAELQDASFREYGFGATQVTVH